MIREDYIQHFIVCLALTLLLSVCYSIIIGIFFALLVGSMKEVYDEEFGNGWSWGDIIADIAGIIMGVLCYYLLLAL